MRQLASGCDVPTNTQDKRRLEEPERPSYVNGEPTQVVLPLGWEEFRPNARIREPQFFESEEHATQWLSEYLSPERFETRRPFEEDPDAWGTRSSDYQLSIPVRELSSYRGEPYGGPKFRDFLKTIEIGENLSVKPATKAQWALDGVAPRIYCRLGTSWRFDKIEARAKPKRPGQPCGNSCILPRLAVAFAARGYPLAWTSHKM